MSFLFEKLLKLFFLFSIIPFLLSEKLQKKYDLKLHPQVTYSIFTGPKKVAEVEEKFIDETSGLAVSRKFPELLYLHNDSGGSAEIFLLDTLGSTAVASCWKGLPIGIGKTWQLVLARLTANPTCTWGTLAIILACTRNC